MAEEYNIPLKDNQKERNFPIVDSRKKKENQNDV